MKLGLLFIPFLLLGCNHHEPPPSIANGHSGTHAVSDGATIALDIGIERCHESGHQLTDEDLVALVCTSTDNKVVVGVVIHKMYWYSLIEGYYGKD